MTIKLFCNAIIKFVLGIILVGLLLFLPAGTVQYPNGWLLMGVLFVPMFVAGIVMMFKNPQLLSKRLNAKEQQSEQSLVIKLSGLMFVVGFVLAGLDFRFGWLSLPKTVPYIAAAIFLIAYLLYAEVLRENTYLSRTIEVQENQKVIDTGLYGIVRHPMYSVTIILMLGVSFMRISKSVLINLQYLECVEPTLGGLMMVTLKNGCKECISRKYLPAFKKYLGL